MQKNKLETRKDEFFAYWYNVKKMTGNEWFIPESSLHIYGSTFSEDIEIKVKVFSSGDLIFNEYYKVNTKENQNYNFNIKFNNDHFRIINKVPYLETFPERIILKVFSQSDFLEKEIKCKYHKISGTITNMKNQPIKAPIAFFPDGYEDMNNCSIGTWSNDNGKYEIYLPERIYHNLMVEPDSYGKTTLEVWGKNIIIDGNENLDFKVGTGEVYGLNAWIGTYNCFISFRPMILPHFLYDYDPNELDNPQDSKKFIPEEKININETEFKKINITPELKKEDINVKINNETTELISLQKYYQTFSENEEALPAYIIQIDRSNLNKNEKNLIKVEYEKTIHKKEKFHKVYSMGIYHLDTNFLGR